MTPAEAKEIFGELADHACLDQIRLDELDARKEKTIEWIIEPSYLEITSVKPVIRFTVQSIARRQSFKSEAVSISKDGKTKFTYFPEIYLRSTSNREQPLHN